MVAASQIISEILESYYLTNIDPGIKIPLLAGLCCRMDYP
jgi:hypothetical protein